MVEIWQWLMQSIDPTRAHSVDVFLAWHARVMVLAWGVVAPVAVLAARYFKIMPWQNWPVELDNPAWWKIHWIGQSIVIALSGLGLALVVRSDHAVISATAHRILGYLILALALAQGLSGLLRGSKGGPTAPAPDGSLSGDHYDMTRRRLVFEAVHKALGHVLLVLAAACIVLGLWSANAPNWMWLIIACWWAALIAAAIWLQVSVGAYDTYQAIWGSGETHPGNRMERRGIGTVRPGDIPRVWVGKKGQR